jgi:DNA (cytosine-5)-methyltransferase 1
MGGIDLSAEWAGFRTVGQVEQNPYANRVLRARFGRRIPRWTDIRDLSAEDFRRRTGIDSPTLISGGFPCQPFSCAGKRKGKEDDRYLWPEMFRIVRELRPDWVLGENVAGIVSMELESCCSDLEGEGYQVRAFLIPACGVGALHRRERVFIVATHDVPNANSSRKSPSRKNRRVGGFGKSLTDVANHAGPRREWTRVSTGSEERKETADACGVRSIVADAHRAGRREQRATVTTRAEHPAIEYGGWGITEPPVCGRSHGISHRVDRLRCLGNAVVPQQVYPILAAIAQIEKDVEV